MGRRRATTSAISASAARARAMFDRLTDGSLRWAALPDVYDRIVLGERSYDYVTGARRFVSKMIGVLPARGRRHRALRDADQARVARRAALLRRPRAARAPSSRIAGPLLRRGYLRYATAHDARGASRAHVRRGAHRRPHGTVR